MVFFRFLLTQKKSVWPIYFFLAILADDQKADYFLALSYKGFIFGWPPRLKIRL
jgi:hypothetical protein